ncbi:hypothetical protein TcCL_Unassigned00165 [Trypanosoma cruzi]|nr:hypothetical protein TcCL_Unassigned00165 [Trypanosoma cruzi]
MRGYGFIYLVCLPSPLWRGRLLFDLRSLLAGFGARSQAHCARRVTAGSLWAVGGVLCAGTFYRGVRHLLHGRCVGARLLGVQHGILVSPTTRQSVAGGEDFVTDGDHLRQSGVGAALQTAEKRGP